MLRTAEKPTLEVNDLVTSFPKKEEILKRNVGEIQAASKSKFLNLSGEVSLPPTLLPRSLK